MIVEVDSLIAYVNKNDKYHEVVSKFFEKVAAGKYKNVRVASSAYLEYSLLLRSKGYSERDIREDLFYFRNFPNLGEAPLTLEVQIRASVLREKHGLSFFDSLHAATALLIDGVIVSLDGAYKFVQGLHALRHDEV
jgi:predicted nucleic acid-binding protein